MGLSQLFPNYSPISYILRRFLLAIVDGVAFLSVFYDVCVCVCVPLAPAQSTVGFPPRVRLHLGYRALRIYKALCVLFAWVCFFSQADPHPMSLPAALTTQTRASYQPLVF